MTIGELLMKFGISVDKNAEGGVMNIIGRIKKTAQKTLDSVKAKVDTSEAVKGFGFLQKSMKALIGLMGIKLGANLAQMLAPDAIEKARKEIKKFFDEILKNSGAAKQLGQVIQKAGQGVLDLLKKLRPYIERTVKTAVNMIQRVVTFIQRLARPIRDIIDKMGGLDNAFRIVLVTAGLLFAILNFSKLAKGLSMIMKLLNPMTLVLIGIALIVEDFIAFMQGRGSIIGDVLEEAGISSEDARAAITEFFESFKDFLPLLLEIGSALAGGFIQAIVALVPLLVKLATGIAPIIRKVLEKILVIITQLVTGGVDILLDVINQLVPLLLTLCDSLLPVIDQFLDLIFDVLSSLITALAPIIESIMELASALLPLIIEVIQTLMGILAPVIEILFELIEAILPVLQPVLEIIATVIGGIFKALVPLLKLLTNIIKAILPPVVEFLGKVSEALGSVSEKLGPIVGFLGDMVGKAKELVNSGLEKVGGFFSGIGSKITGALGGRATGAEEAENAFYAGEHGPELITGQKGKKVFSALSTDKINESLKMLAGLAQPAQPVVNNNSGRNVIQNVNITNNFSGGRDAQVQGANAMDKSARSATDYMAHALNFGRV